MLRRATFETMIRPPSSLMSLAFALALLLTSLQGHCASTDAARQPLQLEGPSRKPYTFALYANADLGQLPSHVRQAVLILHGVKRNADDYFAIGQHLLTMAGLAASDNLLLAPNFMAHKDHGVLPGMPVWGGGAWMQGEPSVRGVTGIASFQVLDDLLRWLGDPRRFPDLREIVLIGHSAGAQLLQRYAVLNAVTEDLQQAGIHMRYVISSPSSYLYLSPERPLGDGFAIPSMQMQACPRYDDYRYGLQHAPAYLPPPQLDGRQLFARYAARDVRYMVGARDTDPQHRYLDHACGAAMQGQTRVARQLAYVGSERYLSQRWQIPVDHPQRQIPGAAHGAARLFGAPEAVQWIFPTPSGAVRGESTGSRLP